MWKALRIICVTLLFDKSMILIYTFCTINAQNCSGKLLCESCCVRKGHSLQISDVKWLPKIRKKQRKKIKFVLFELKYSLFFANTLKLHIIFLFNESHNESFWIKL